MVGDGKIDKTSVSTTDFDHGALKQFTVRPLTWAPFTQFTMSAMMMTARM